MACRRPSARSRGASGAGVALAGLLVASPDLLLLDEPTNHLDVEGVAWLADHLVTRHARPDNAVVAITHDRWFLDAIATQTWEVDAGEVHSYEGGYAAFVLAKAERERMAGVVAERRDNLLRKELAWLRRGPPARTSKPKFRIDAANALIADEPPARDDVELVAVRDLRGSARTSSTSSTRRIVLGDRVLLDHVTWRLAPGERIGIVGVNGAGKSTLLRAIAGELPLAAGQAQGRRHRAHRRALAGGARARGLGRPPGHRGGRGRALGRPPGRQGAHRVPARASGSASPAPASRPGSATCPAASAGGCS